MDEIKNNYENENLAEDVTNYDYEYDIVPTIDESAEGGGLLQKIVVTAGATLVGLAVGWGIKKHCDKKNGKPKRKRRRLALVEVEDDDDIYMDENVDGEVDSDEQENESED